LRDLEAVKQQMLDAKAVSNLVAAVESGRSAREVMELVAAKAGWLLRA